MSYLSFIMEIQRISSIGFLGYQKSPFRSRGKKYGLKFKILKPRRSIFMLFPLTSPSFSDRWVVPIELNYFHKEEKKWKQQ